MSKFVLILAAATLAVGSFAAPSPAHADNLLLKRVQQEKSMDLPTRGMTMAAVESRFGAPLHKLDPRGGDAPLHPVINRWEYPGYIVYFEHDHVIHTVLNTPAGNNRHPKQAK
ncbi:MAG TPA: hypothetical protein VFJ01_07770 [Oleiagrimonas sp.]|nr:hypothetical protein [Oleiagrimonas sp.]